MKRAHSRQLVRLAVFVATTAIVAVTSSCGEPVHDLQVKALGGESPQIPTSEFHRAGQPCNTCHGGLGPASRVFSISGTIFNNPETAVGEDSVEIELVDALGYKPPGKVLTNCVGNFFVEPSVWDPAYPVLVWIRKGDQLTKMVSHIGREASCSQCHKDPQSFDSPGHVRLFPVQTATPKVDNCPTSPDLGGGGK